MECQICGGFKGSIKTYNIQGYSIRGHKDCHTRMENNYLIWFLKKAKKIRE